MPNKPKKIITVKDTDYTKTPFNDAKQDEAHKQEPDPIDFDNKVIIPSASADIGVGVSPLLNIDDTRWIEIESDLKKIIERSIEDRAPFLAKLEEYELAIQGIPEPQRKKPWDNACELRDTLTPTHCRIIETAINRTLIGDNPYIARVKDDPIMGMKLQALINTIVKDDIGWDAMVTSMSKGAVRKCAAFLVPRWLRVVEKERDVEYYQTFETWKEEYPNAKAANLSKSEYDKEVDIVKANIKNNGVHSCIYEYDCVTQNKAQVDVITAEKLIMHPFNSPDVELAQMIGQEITNTLYGLRQLERMGYLKNVNRVIETQTNGMITPTTSTIINENKGLTTSVASINPTDKLYKIISGIVRYDLNQDGNEKDYEFMMVYDVENTVYVLVRFAVYSIFYNKRNYIPVQILPEDGTVFGTSIPELVENPQATMDVVLRLLIDSNSMANVPLFKASATDKEMIENSRDKGKIFPGRIFYVTQSQNFDAFRADRIDAAAFINIMRYVRQITELQDGASATLAGQNLPDDPEAPGVKTAMLIQQSNFMVNEYLKNIRLSFMKLAPFLLKLYRQNLGAETRTVQVQYPDKSTELINITRDDIMFMDNITKFDLKIQKVEDSVFSRQQAILRDLDLFLRIPQISQNPHAMRILSLHYMIAREEYSEDEINQIVPSYESIQQQMVGVAQEALKQEEAQANIEQLKGAAQEQADKADSQINEVLKEQK